MAAPKISLDHKDFIALTGFLDSLGNKISKLDFQNAAQDPALVEAITEFIASEIKEATGHDKFARFMADRTYVEINATTRGIRFEIGGYTELEMKNMGKEARISEKAIGEGKDYNLWEMYELHGKGITGVTLGEPRSKGSNNKIVKDAGGVITVKSKTGESVDLKGRAGLIRSVVDQLRQELAFKVAEFLGASAAKSLAEAANEAAKKARGIEGIVAITEVAVARAAKKYGVNLAKISSKGLSLGVTSQGRITSRNKLGQFASSELHGKKVPVTSRGAG